MCLKFQSQTLATPLTKSDQKSPKPLLWQGIISSKPNPQTGEKREAKTPKQRSQDFHRGKSGGKLQYKFGFRSLVYQSRNLPVRRNVVVFLSPFGLGGEKDTW